MHVIISLFWLILSAEQLACNACRSSEVEPLPLASLLLPSVLPFASSHLSFLSLLWITGTVHRERAVQMCPRCQNRATPILLSFCSLLFPAFRRERLGGGGAEVTIGPAGQLVPIASRGPFFILFWGPPSQPGCSDVRRAGHEPSGNVQAATHGGNRWTPQTRTGHLHAQWLPLRFLTRRSTDTHVEATNSVETRDRSLEREGNASIYAWALTPQATYN